MKSKEKIAVDYIFFRNPSVYAIVILPIFSGIFSVFVNPVSNSISEMESIELFNLQQYLIINNFMMFSKLILVLVLAFFITFKWSSMIKSGAYGFWLTQRVDRTKFYIRTYFYVTIYVILSYFIGLLLLIHPIGLKLSYTQFLYLFSLILVNILLIVSCSILFAELITYPEVAALSFTIVFGILIIWVNKPSTLIHQLIKSELHYAETNIFFPMIVPLLVSLACIGVSFISHIKKPVEL
ncbi:MAG: hypothetical protein OEZ01_13500 [Candidatus Heimdallarchaeota archaeon]|nr:hypothetical protein [Candidatus Heimdallarchaeota archaeon]